MDNHTVKIATITLNPAIDQTVSIPNFKAGEVNRVVQLRSDPGGKGVNVASFLADYGYPTAVTGFLGDENSRLFERLFSEKGIQDAFVRLSGSTRTGIKIIDEVNQQTTDINFPGLTPSDQNVTDLFQAVNQLATDCDWFVLSGSMPSGAPTELYRQLVEEIKGRGRSVALDTSGEGLRRALLAAPTLVKPNIHELEELVEQRLESLEAITRAAQQLLADGIQVVVVSMGEEGALFTNRDEVVLAVPPQVAVKSTVGAGDAMVSGSVAGLIEGYRLSDCARLATAFAAAAITHIGAGLPSLDEVESLRDQVGIKTIFTLNKKREEA